METFTAFEYAVASTAEIIKGTAPDQADLPTPCSEWDVRSLLSHVIGTLWLTEALFTGQAPRYPMAPGGLPDTDPGGDDPVAAYAEASAAALAAVGAGDALSRVHVTPLGEMPGPPTCWRSPGRPWPRPICGVRASARPGRFLTTRPSRSDWLPSLVGGLNRLRP